MIIGGGAIYRGRPHLSLLKNQKTCKALPCRFRTNNPNDFLILISYNLINYMILLFEAFLLGLIGGAVPGPILTGTFSEILLSASFLRGMRIIFWALMAETVGALFTIYIFYQLEMSKVVIQIISICGAVVLFWLASKIWKINKINSESKKILTFSQIIFLTALNGGYWIFWITIGVPKALLLGNILLEGKFIFLILFEFGWFFATTLLAFIFFKSRPLLERKNLVGITFKILALVLVVLGIKTLAGVF